jgi:hypothetical protein
LWYKYNNKYTKADILNLIRKGDIESLYIFGLLSNDDMELYLDTFYDLIKNDTNKYNYFKCREIMYKKNINSTRIKKNVSKALEYINKVDDNYTIKILLLKHQLNYILNDFEKSHKYPEVKIGSSY